MATSHMRSITSSVIKFIKTKLCLVSKFRLLFSNPQAATTHLNELSESHSEHNSIEGMRTSCSSNINEVSVQVKYNNKQYRSRYDIHVNLCQQNLRRRRSRAVSRIPTIQIKRLLQKSKKVVIKVQKHVRRVVPQSSKLHAYLCKKSSAYHKLNSESYGIGDHQHRSVRKQRSNLSKKDCCPKQQRLYLLFVQTRTRKHKKSVACVYTDEHGLNKLKCSCVQILCVAQRIIALSGDVEENPGPCTQINNDKNAQCAKQVNSVSLLESRLSELGRIPVNVLGDGNCFFRAVSCQLYNTPEYHLYIRSLGVQHLLHHPELYIESNFEYSWQNYMDNMARQGTWADNIIIQAVANSLNITINIIESDANFSPVTVINPVNSDRQTTNIYIGHIQEYHYMSTIPVPNSNTYEMTCGNEPIQKSASSNKSELEQCKQKQFSQDKNAPLVNGDKENGKRAKLSEKDKAERRKASKREFIQKKRENPDYRKRENRMRAVASECDTDMNLREKIERRKTSQREFIRKKRADAVTRLKDNHKRIKLSEADKADKRRTSNRENMRKKRQNVQKVNIQNKANCYHNGGVMSDPDANAYKSVINKFHKKISCGPEYICTCCDQLWYKSSVTKCNANNYSKCQQNIVQSCITGVKSVNNTEWICNTCHLNIKQGKLPQCSKANGMGFPDKPSVLDLTPLEERLISPRIPFMQIRELPRGGQLSIHGNVVNVPSDVNSTVHTLPRLISDSQTVPIKLKRRLSYKHHYQFQNVRPKKVLEAAQYLVTTSELFKSEGIEVQDTWQNTVTTHSEENSEWGEFLNNDNIEKDSEKEIRNIVNNNKDNSGCLNSEAIDDEDNDDNWCEVDERHSGVTDTLLQDPEIAGNGDNIISFAPGEGNKPLGIFMDKDSEFLSFPTIFCGKRRADNKTRKVPVSYSSIAKWELRCQDRRAAQSVPNVFYKLKKLQIKQIQDTASISLRKCKTKGKKYTAGDFKSDDYVNKLIHLDEGFRVLKNLRGSPAYFQKCKKDLFAMIRQLGNPTWFCSFSAAETRWTHLPKTLGRILEKKEYSNEEINNMTWQQKSNLIQRDPITCARNFEHMVQLFIHDVLRSDVMPIGQIVDFFYRVEFQQRGSPHIHGLFWVKDAPQYGKNDEKEIVKFIDKYVTCQKADTSEMEELVNLQLHRHAKTCKKMGHKVCRFNFPLPPMRQTIILTPLEEYETFDDDKQKNIKENGEKIKEQLDSMKYGEDINFDQFLKKIALTEENYILALRHIIKRNTLFLKRLPSEIRINNYNTQLLKAWRANMDMQYVLDPYACATYILSYITKGQRGMSRLLEKATEEVKSGNKDISQKVRHIGNKFLNAVEISAQEAAYLVLQMPMRRSTREFQFINTSHPDERAFLLKKLDKIKELPDNSCDIESDSIIKRYQRRPKQLENVCLADFVALFNCVKDNESATDFEDHDKCDIGSDNFLPETLFDANTNDDDPYKMDDDINEEQSEPLQLKLKGGMKLVKRTKPKIIRSVRFHKSKDPENHYREQLMLYSPWRNENTDLLRGCETYQERFSKIKEVVFSNRQNYEYHSEILDKAMEDLDNDYSENISNSVAPNAQHINEQDIATNQKPSELFGCFDPGNNKQHSQYDLLDDIGIFPRCNDQEELLLKRISNDEYCKLVRSLNEKQRQFFYHVLHSVKTSDEPLRLFLSGGAGVGKSTVTNALYEALIRYLNSIAGENPDEINVIKAAPTGKAAFNIKGNTLHAAFKIPANKGFEYCALDSDRLNTIRAKLRKLKVVFIDEISMVGSGMFNFLNLRLQQIMGSKEPFGGITVITVGDLFQLKPVFDRWIFEAPNTSYSALATNLWANFFTLFELTDIMRQKDDKQFAELLNRLREGKHSDHDINCLKRRLLHTVPGNENYPMETTHLFTTNASVNAHNNSMYAKCENDKCQIKAIDIVVGDISDDLKKQMKDKIPNDPTKTMGLYSLTSIATNAKYDLTTNVDVTDGLTNGAECVIKNIDYRVENSSRPSIIWVLFPDTDIGKKQRKENMHLYNTKPIIDKTWTPILEVTRQFRINRKNQVQILRRQFPLRPASAKTIHRCQGDTLNAAVVDFPRSTQEHMHYVGLSRVRNSSSLHIINLNEHKIRVSEKVVNEMNRLRTEAYLVPSVTLKTLDHTITIVFQNVRSLHLHIDDVRSDYNIQKADVNIFVETRLCTLDKDDEYNMKEFTLYRNDYNQSPTRSCYGSAVYVKNHFDCSQIPHRFNFNGVEITIMVIEQVIPNLHVIGIYRSSSNVNLTKLIDALNYLHDSKLTSPEIPVVLLGDFNVNLLEKTFEQKALTRCLVEEKGYTQLIKQYTTDYRSLIDHIYTNIPHFVRSSGVLESYYSDHKPLFISLKTE